MPASRWTGSGSEILGQVCRIPVRHGLGRAARFGWRRENALPAFDLLAPNRPLCCIENPRVDGSIAAERLGLPVRFRTEEVRS